MAPTSTISYQGGLHPLAGDEDSDVYRGYDADSGRRIVLAAGEQTDVSQATAARLADDFPGFFEIDGKLAGNRAAGKQTGAGDLREQLLGHKRPELNAAATEELGIDAAEALPNKAAVVDAILAAKAAVDEQT